MLEQSTIQSTSANIATLLEAAQQVKEQLGSLRIEDLLEKITREAEETVEKFNLDPLRIPRRKLLPKRLCGPATAYHPYLPEFSGTTHTALLVGPTMKFR